jgi:transposase
MKMPAQINPWLNDDELAQWVREAPTQDAYKKRLAIWLTRRGPFHAHRVSDLLQVSKQAVWLWIKQYNQGGPDSLDRKGRGGRRRAYLSLDQERELVERLQTQVAKGQGKKAKELLPEVLEAVGQNVSVAYVYRLMQRHERRRGPASKPLPAKHVNESDMPAILEAIQSQPPSVMPAPNPMG